MGILVGLSPLTSQIGCTPHSFIDKTKITQNPQIVYKAETNQRDINPNSFSEDQLVKMSQSSKIIKNLANSLDKKEKIFANYLAYGINKCRVAENNTLIKQGNYTRNGEIRFFYIFENDEGEKTFLTLKKVDILKAHQGETYKGELIRWFRALENSDKAKVCASVLGHGDSLVIEPSYKDEFNNQVISDYQACKTQREQNITALHR